MDHWHLFHLLLVFGVAAQDIDGNQTTAYSTKSENTHHLLTSNNDNATSSHASTTTVRVSAPSSPKVHTPCPTDSCPQCLVGDKEARVLVILLGVTLIICAALLVSTVVLATQLCQQQQWRPNPRPLRSNTSFIRAQEERANGSPVENETLLIQEEEKGIQEVNMVEQDGRNRKDEHKGSMTQMSSIQETEEATPACDPSPDPGPDPCPSPALSIEPAAGEA